MQTNGQNTTSEKAIETVASAKKRPSRKQTKDTRDKISINDRDQSSSLGPVAATGKVGQQACAASHEDVTKEIAGHHEELSMSQAESSIQICNKKQVVSSRRHRKNSDISHPKGKLVLRCFSDSLDALAMLNF